MTIGFWLTMRSTQHLTAISIKLHESIFTPSNSKGPANHKMAAPQCDAMAELFGWQSVCRHQAPPIPSDFGRLLQHRGGGGGRRSGVMASSMWKGLVGIGLFALAHAAFSAAQHRSYMRLTEKEDETLPIDIVLQTLLAFVLTCYGIAHIAGEFKDMDATSELKNKTFDTLRNHPSFYVFNHRGRVLFQSPDSEDSSSNQSTFTSNASLKLRKVEPQRR
ncbi:hypothetical protein FKM82_002460 [Ascaphus truei]